MNDGYAEFKMVRYIIDCEREIDSGKRPTDDIYFLASLFDGLTEEGKEFYRACIKHIKGELHD